MKTSFALGVSGIVFLQLPLWLCLGVFTARVWSLLSVSFYTWGEEWTQFYVSVVHLKTSELIVIFYFGNLYSQDAIIFFHILEKIFSPWQKKSIFLRCLWANVLKRNIGWHTVLQARRSRVGFPLVSLEFFIHIILPAALWPWGWLSLWQKWVPGIFPRG